MERLITSCGERNKLSNIKENPGNPGVPKLLAAAVIIILSFFLVFSYFNDIIDARTLSLRAAKALENTRSYQFDISSNLSFFNEELQVMSAKGKVDTNNKKMHVFVNSSDRQVEAIVIGDKTYARETNGPWQVRQVNELSIWKDKLSEQRSILENARNLTMYRENGTYILEIVPEKEEVLRQMREAGLDDSKIELKRYVIRYRIEPYTYYIRKAETYADIEMNFRGMQTSMKLTNIINLSDFNEKMSIEAPV